MTKDELIIARDAAIACIDVVTFFGADVMCSSMRVSLLEGGSEADFLDDVKEHVERAEKRLDKYQANTQPCLSHSEQANAGHLEIFTLAGFDFATAHETAGYAAKRMARIRWLLDLIDEGYGDKAIAAMRGKIPADDQTDSPIIDAISIAWHGMDLDALLNLSARVKTESARAVAMQGDFSHPPEGWITFTDAKTVYRNALGGTDAGASSALRRWRKKDPDIQRGHGRAGRWDPQRVLDYTKNPPE